MDMLLRKKLPTSRFSKPPKRSLPIERLSKKMIAKELALMGLTRGVNGRSIL
jgi:hypothetical protein